MQEIIRKGDSTDHGGRVLEGFPQTNLNGMPMAGIGHQVSCPIPLHISDLGRLIALVTKADLPQTRHVCVGDRESDMVELMRKARDLGYPADYLIRSQHNRVLPDGGVLWDQVMQSAPLGHIRSW